MPITCPACNKANQAEAACQRCGCDLSLLQDIAERASSRLNAAVAAFKARDWPGALAHAERSWSLRHETASAQMAFLAAAATGDTARALDWRSRVED